VKLWGLKVQAGQDGEWACRCCRNCIAQDVGGFRLSLLMHINRAGPLLQPFKSSLALEPSDRLPSRPVPKCLPLTSNLLLLLLAPVGSSVYPTL
jgi:hypothetical protein